MRLDSLFLILVAAQVAAMPSDFPSPECGGYDGGHAASLKRSGSGAGNDKDEDDQDGEDTTKKQKLLDGRSKHTHSTRSSLVCDSPFKGTVRAARAPPTYGQQ